MANYHEVDTREAFVLGLFLILICLLFFVQGIEALNQVDAKGDMSQVHVRGAHDLNGSLGEDEMFNNSKHEVPTGPNPVANR